MINYCNRDLVDAVTSSLVWIVVVTAAIVEIICNTQTTIAIRMVAITVKAFYFCNRCEIGDSEFLNK